jgi:hypothetical protein
MWCKSTCAFSPRRRIGARFRKSSLRVRKKIAGWDALDRVSITHAISHRSQSGNERPAYFRFWPKLSAVSLSRVTWGFVALLSPNRPQTTGVGFGEVKQPSNVHGSYQPHEMNGPRIFSHKHRLFESGVKESENRELRTLPAHSPPHLNRIQVRRGLVVKGFHDQRLFTGRDENRGNEIDDPRNAKHTDCSPSRYSGWQGLGTVCRYLSPTCFPSREE